MAGLGIGLAVGFTALDLVADTVTIGVLIGTSVGFPCCDFSLASNPKLDISTHIWCSEGARITDWSARWLRLFARMIFDFIIFRKLLFLVNPLHEVPTSISGFSDVEKVTAYQKFRYLVDLLCQILDPCSNPAVPVTIASPYLLLGSRHSSAKYNECEAEPP